MSLLIERLKEGFLNARWLPNACSCKTDREGPGDVCYGNTPTSIVRALTLANSGRRVLAQQFIDDLRCTVDLVKVGNARPEEDLVHADAQARFDGGSHSFRRRGDGLRQPLRLKVMREILPGALTRIRTQGKRGMLLRSAACRACQPPSKTPRPGGRGRAPAPG